MLAIEGYIVLVLGAVEVVRGGKCVTLIVREGVDQFQTLRLMLVLTVGHKTFALVV